MSKVAKNKPNTTRTVSYLSQSDDEDGDENKIKLSIASNDDTRSSFKKHYSYAVLLIVNILERFAYYGLLSNYILYLNKKPFYWESYNASLISFLFLGLTHVFSVIGGWIADSLLGRYNTICISFAIYIIGYSAYPFMAFNEKEVPQFCHYDNNNTFIDIVPIGFNETVVIPVVNRTITQEPCSWLIFISIIFISFAVGFVKTNIGPFGADQV
jgi:peptide/histidine transporter 3/4